MRIIDTQFELLIVVASVAAVLAVATVIGRLLAVRYSATGPNATIANLNARLDAWWVMLALTSIAFAFDTTGMVVLFGLLSFVALREFMTLTRSRPADHWTLIAAFFVAVPAQYYLIWTEWYGLYSILIPVYAFVLMPVISALRGEPKAFLERVAEAQWGVMICVYCLSYVPALATLPIPDYKAQLLVPFFLLVVQMSDVFQYVWGNWLGKTPVASTLSPAKTVEGTMLGIVSATALGAGLWWMTPFTPWQAAMLSLVTTSMGFLGGLVMSAIKRDRGVKDWGWLVQGHGGILDRLDSVVFAAPVFFHITRYWWTI
jgi:phosphatidate cytidylyltransferase